MSSVVLSLSPAKVNLALSVSPPLEGGMHEIASWMVTTAFADELEVKRLPADRPSRFSIDWHDDARRRTDIDWPIRKDLAVRAHALLEQKLGCALPIQLRLRKRIPVGGGLGGGSSNAAAMLRALDALFDLRLRAEYLEAISRELGSDVPFLVRGGSALVVGTGERLTRVAMPLVHLVLVFPAVACPTGAVYHAFDRLRPDARLDAPRVRALVDAADMGALCADMGALRADMGALRADMGALRADMPFNDLADAACEVAPALAELRARIERVAQSPVHVSGSGSTLFIVCDSSIHAEALAGAVEMQTGVPAVATVTAPTPPEEVDGEPRAIGAPAAVDDDE
jgi:4-diphosphocytidyl-2-C-methyl-D-erythritol kinase